jgi:glycerophosphoryl diester phosphodiesterase
LQVWLTSDNRLVVIHGGYSGEINFGSFKEAASSPSSDSASHSSGEMAAKTHYIFDQTLEYNRQIETDFELPTLRQVF